MDATSHIQWKLSLSPPVLQSESVHLWKVDSSRLPSIKLDFEPLLSSDETERANRFKFAKDRDQFCVTRGILRWLLGHYTGRDPATLSFEYGKWGKPFLAGNSQLPDFRFNVSHTRGVALLGVARAMELGIDVEFMKREPDFRSIAQNHFSESERSDLDQARPKQLMPCFYRCWTRKEAVIKAHGGGLSVPLDAFSVSTLPFGHTERVPFRSRLAQLASLNLFHLETNSPNHAASLALQGEPRAIRCFELSS